MVLALIVFIHHPVYLVGCQEMSTHQEMRDLNFPFKFDLTTNSIRSKIASRGYQLPSRGGFEFEHPAGRYPPNDNNASYKVIVRDKKSFVSDQLRLL